MNFSARRVFWQPWLDEGTDLGTSPDVVFSTAAALASGHSFKTFVLFVYRGIIEAVDQQTTSYDKVEEGSTIEAS